LNPSDFHQQQGEKAKEKTQKIFVLVTAAIQVAINGCQMVVTSQRPLKVVS